jgi:hypothetical protein
MKSVIQSWRPALALIVLVIFGWWAYTPGLTGGFIFDDFKNLNAIGDYGAVDNVKNLLLYISSGTADPTGRPLALASFLIDANGWPSDPAPFKRTNILIHLLNGLLLAWTLLRLGRHVGQSQRQSAISGALGALLWTLHPLWVSTTLYVVQREAMLPATFALIGILLWTIGREKLATQPRCAVALLVTAAWVCTLLATLSKANGILLPALLLVIDQTVLNRESSPPEILLRKTRRLRMVLLGLPTLAVLLYLSNVVVKSATDIHAAGSLGPWRRIITESRVVLDYLKNLWIPRPELSGLFHDDFPASAGLLKPATTLFSLVFLSCLVSVALAFRRKHPAFSCAVLFFFVGHLLESTVVPLELYYEHRNYLPALLMYWPLSIWLSNATPAMARTRTALIIGLPCLLAFLTHSRSLVWDNPYRQAVLFARASPNSPRAQVTAAYYHLKHGHARLAAAMLRTEMRKHPDEILAPLHLAEAECAMGALAPNTRPQLLRAVEYEQEHFGVLFYWLLDEVPLATSGDCHNFDLNFLNAMVATLSRNSIFEGRPLHLRDIQYLQGRLDLARHQPEGALIHFDASLLQNPSPDQALVQASLLGSVDPKLGLAHLAYFRTLPAPSPGPFRGMQTVHNYLLRRTGYWTYALSQLNHQLAHAANSKQKVAASGRMPAAHRAPTYVYSSAPQSPPRTSNETSKRASTTPNSTACPDR